MKEKEVSRTTNQSVSVVERTSGAINLAMAVVHWTTSTDRKSMPVTLTAVRYWPKWGEWEGEVIDGQVWSARGERLGSSNNSQMLSFRTDADDAELKLLKWGHWRYNYSSTSNAVKRVTFTVSAHSLPLAVLQRTPWAVLEYGHEEVLQEMTTTICSLDVDDDNEWNPLPFCTDAAPQVYCLSLSLRRPKSVVCLLQSALSSSVRHTIAKWIRQQ